MKVHKIFLIFLILSSCISQFKLKSINPQINSEETLISEISSSSNPLLAKEDITRYFCNNMTEYFNKFNYYSISSEVYYEKEKQIDNSASKITKRRDRYDVEYIGSSGRYIVTFTNNIFLNSEKIITFSRQTVLGNAIRGKVYDTFVAFVNKEEIALKSNNNSSLFMQELISSVEIEDWYNRLSSDGKAK